MKSLGNAIQKIRNDVRAEFGKENALHKGLGQLTAVAEEIKGKSIRAFEAVKNAVGDHTSPQPFLKNIRQQMDQSIDRAFNRSAYELKQKKAELLSKAPKSSGFGIDIRAGWIAAMKSNLTVVSGGFAKGQMRGAAKFYGGKESETLRQLSHYLDNPIKPSHRFFTKTTAANEMVCFPQTIGSISSQAIEERIVQAVGDTAGAIVIQVDPDGVVDGVPTFSDECLKANLHAARRLNADARQKNIDRSITFVLPDKYSEVLAKLGAMNESA
jgi:hypothetical protein